MRLYDIKSENLKKGDSVSFVFAETFFDNNLVGSKAYNTFQDFAECAGIGYCYKTQEHLCTVSSVTVKKPNEKRFYPFGKETIYTAVLDNHNGESFVLTGINTDDAGFLTRNIEIKRS